MGINLTTVKNLDSDMEERRKHEIDNDKGNAEDKRPYEIDNAKTDHTNTIEEIRRDENGIEKAIHTETIEEKRRDDDNKTTEDEMEMNWNNDMEDELDMNWKDDVLFVDVANFSLSTGIIRKNLATNLGGNWPRFTVATLGGQGALEEEQPPSWRGEEEEQPPSWRGRGEEEQPPWRGGGEDCEMDCWGTQRQWPLWVTQDYRQDGVEEKEQNDNVEFLSKIGCDVMFNFQLGNDIRIENRLFSKVVFTFPNQLEARTEDLLWGSRGLLAPEGELVMMGTHAAMPGKSLVMFSYKNTREKDQEEDGRGI